MPTALGVLTGENRSDRERRTGCGSLVSTLEGVLVAVLGPALRIPGPRADHDLSLEY